MKFRNPWIDPRIAEVRPEDVRAYLTRHGLQAVGPASDPNLVRFERVAGGEEAPTLFVPVQVRPGSLLGRMIECVADLARYEGRWAVEVLSDIMRQAAGDGRPVNGPSLPAPPEPARH
jgi:hypothetical protein